MENPERPSMFGLAAATGLGIWATYHLAPIVVGGDIRPLPAAVAALTALAGLKLAGESLLQVAKGMEWVSSHGRGTGKSGTAQWSKAKDIKKELCKEDAGPFLGASVDGHIKLFIDFESNAYVIGPAGSGKGHTIVVPLIFLIPHSKVIMDFKPELLAICQKGLKEDLGQTVIALDPFRVHGSYSHKTYCLNPLDAISDNLFHKGGLRHVFSDAGELALQLYEEPPNAKGDDQYWRKGSRKILSLICLLTCMMQGARGTLEDVALLLDDPTALELRLCSVVGEDLEGKPDPQGEYLFELSDWAKHHSERKLAAFLKSLRAKARGLLTQMRQSEKTFASFSEGAQQAVEPYGFGELSSAMGPTNFDINAIKDPEKILNLFIAGDASRTNATEKFFGIMQWLIQLKIKRHPNKKVPVYFINDEASNYSIYGLVSLMTWGRGFGIRLIQIFQNFSAYAAKHGKQAVDVLISESEIKLHLPGIRSDEDLKKVTQLLGEQSVMVASYSSGKDGAGQSENMSEAGRKLLTEDELRRSPYGILIVRQQRPILQRPISYSEISPLRDMADINPHHGQPFRKKIKLKLKLPKSLRGKS